MSETDARCKIGKITYKNSNLVSFPSKKQLAFQSSIDDLRKALNKYEVSCVSFVVLKDDGGTYTHIAHNGDLYNSQIKGAISQLHDVAIENYSDKI